MKIKAEFEVPDEEQCGQCEHWGFRGRSEVAFCNKFDEVIARTPCQPCLDARKEASE